MLTARATTPVHEIMTPSPVTVGATTMLADLVQLFDRHDFNAFPVTDASNALLGIVTKLDLLRVLRPQENLELPEPAAVERIPAAEIMRPGVISLEGEDPIGVAADLMVETGLRSVPVVRRTAGRTELLGMVSRGDVLRGLRYAMSDSR